MHRWQRVSWAPAAERVSPAENEGVQAPALQRAVSIMRTPLERAAQWRKRAEEYRTVAENMNNPSAKATYLDLARSYEALADHAEAERPKSKLKCPW
jgi:hypothetical protein